MSERQTGATDEPNEDIAFAGGGLSEELIAKIVDVWNYLEKDGAVPYGALIRAAWDEITDAARVPTERELLAMRRVLRFGMDEVDTLQMSECEIVRAYLERQR